MQILRNGNTETQLMKEYLNELNGVQQNAVTTIDGPVLVIAGPGSGKTRVLTYRIAHIIESGVAPYEILSLTFTNKSAKEMKERIAKVVGNRGNYVYAGTFHSIFARILRSEAEQIGYPSNFTIYDSDDSTSVINAIIKEMNLDKTVYNTNTIKSKISLSKNNLITPKLYAADESILAADRAAKRPYTHKIYQEYVLRCQRSGAMDFDDLLYQLFRLFQEKPEVLKKYQAKFKYVLVDEFQDTNFLQYSILKKLVNYEGSPQNLCVVGDDAQSIYAFRGATIDNILYLEKDFKRMQTFKLEQNYRSTNFIVQAANDIIGNNKNQIKKEIWTDKEGGNKIKLIKTMTDVEEGKRVVDFIIEQKNRSHLYNKDIAILYRTNAQSRVFEEYLRRYNIQYRVFGGMSFYQRKEVKDLIAYLRLIVNPKDDEATRRVINYPRRGIGESTIEKVSAFANSKQSSLWHCLTEVELSTAARRGVNDFIALARTFQQYEKTHNAYETAAYVARQSKLIETLKEDKTDEGVSRLENINALLDGIKDFVENDELQQGEEAIADKSLSTYLQNIALFTDADDNKDDVDRVVLMSVHAAKGLEFKSVFVVGLEENIFPSFMAQESLDGISEERRLFYVAITRAEEFLTLSYAGSRNRYGKMVYNPVSRFVEEINYANLEGGMLSVPNGGAMVSEQRTRLTGNFKPVRSLNEKPRIDPKDFRPSSSDKIQEGMTILHLKFGEGKVTKIDGANENRVATIVFELTEEPEKRIMLKFAKLQIVD